MHTWKGGGEREGKKRHETRYTARFTFQRMVSWLKYCSSYYIATDIPVYSPGGVVCVNSQQKQSMCLTQNTLTRIFYCTSVKTFINHHYSISKITFW